MNRAATILLAVTSIVVIGIDQLSKIWIVEWLGLRTDPDGIDVWPPFLQFRMGWNTGVNFGLFDGQSESQRWLLIGLAVAISIGLTIWAIRAGRRFIAMACGLIIGGALGNAWDRVTYGAVADFLNMSCCGIENPFVFNIADTAIFLGAALLILAPSGPQKT